MKAVGWTLVAALCAATPLGAKANFWFDPAPGFGVPDVPPEARGGPYYVAGFGDEHANVPRRYWGGPYFVSCSGRQPPFETYRLSCRPAVVNVAIHHEHQRGRARLK